MCIIKAEENNWGFRNTYIFNFLPLKYKTDLITRYTRI